MYILIYIQVNAWVLSAHLMSFDKYIYLCDP